MKRMFGKWVCLLLTFAGVVGANAQGTTGMASGRAGGVHLVTQSGRLQKLRPHGSLAGHAVFQRRQYVPAAVFAHEKRVAEGMHGEHIAPGDGSFGKGRAQSAAVAEGGHGSEGPGVVQHGVGSDHASEAVVFTAQVLLISRPGNRRNPPGPTAIRRCFQKF